MKRLRQAMANEPNLTADLSYWLQCLQFPDPTQRAHAATILGMMGAKARGAVPALIEAFRDEDVRVRRTVVAALHEIGPANRTAVPALVTALRDRHERVRRRAAQGLAEMGPEARAAVPALIQALADPAPLVRRWSAAALGEIGPRAAEAAPALVELFRDPSPASRAVAATALCRLGPEVAPVLLPALADDDPQVRRHAVLTLGKCQGDPDELLTAAEQAARDPDPSVRAAAIDAWEAIVLRRAAEDDPDLLD